MHRKTKKSETKTKKNIKRAALDDQFKRHRRLELLENDYLLKISHYLENPSIESGYCIEKQTRKKNITVEFEIV